MIYSIIKKQGKIMFLEKKRIIFVSKKSWHQKIVFRDAQKLI